MNQKQNYKRRDGNNQSMDYKQVILVRQDLKLTKGKMAAQAAHAAVEAVLRSDKAAVKHWHSQGMKKVVLKVKDEAELLRYLQLAKDAELSTALITDAGKTHVAPGTKTCIAIGPGIEQEIDAITGALAMA